MFFSNKCQIDLANVYEAFSVLASNHKFEGFKKHPILGGALVSAPLSIFIIAPQNNAPVIRGKFLKIERNCKSNV